MGSEEPLHEDRAARALEAEFHRQSVTLSAAVQRFLACAHDLAEAVDWLFQRNAYPEVTLLESLKQIMGDWRTAARVAREMLALAGTPETCIEAIEQVETFLNGEELDRRLRDPELGVLLILVEAEILNDGARSDEPGLRELRSALIERRTMHRLGR